MALSSMLPSANARIGITLQREIKIAIPISFVVAVQLAKLTGGFVHRDMLCVRNKTVHIILAKLQYSLLFITSYKKWLTDLINYVRI